jgi:hypothetical protein
MPTFDKKNNNKIPQKELLMYRQVYMGDAAAAFIEKFLGFFFGGGGDSVLISLFIQSKYCLCKYQDGDPLYQVPQEFQLAKEPISAAAGRVQSAQDLRVSSE